MNKKQIVITLLIIAGILFIKCFSLIDYLTFENIRTHAIYLKQQVHNNYSFGVLFFIITYTLVTAFSIPGAAPLTMLAGFLFGVFAGTLYVNIGATSGATGAFLLTRYIAGSDIQKKYHQQLSTFNANVTKNGIMYLLTIRLIPILPFFLINILAGLTTLSLHTFIWTTSLGIIPGTLIYTFAGKQLTTLNSPYAIISGPYMAIILFLIGLIIISLYVKKHKKILKR